MITIPCEALMSDQRAFSMSKEDENKLKRRMQQENELRIKKGKTNLSGLL